MAEKLQPEPIVLSCISIKFDVISPEEMSRFPIVQVQMKTQVRLVLPSLNICICVCVCVCVCVCRCWGGTEEGLAHTRQMLNSELHPQPVERILSSTLHVTFCACLLC
jgi:hypothetical protein